MTGTFKAILGRKPVRGTPQVRTDSTEDIDTVGIANYPHPLRFLKAGTDLSDLIVVRFPRLEERQKQLARTMSGGERQMLAVGRALMSDPKLLMLDEPSLGLAPAIVESMYETFGRLHREGLTILLAEQSIELALEVSDFATVLQVGKSVLSGTAAALAQDPQVQHAYLGTA